MSVVQLTVQVNDPPGGSSPWLGVSPMAIPFPPTTYGAKTASFGIVFRSLRHDAQKHAALKTGSLFAIQVYVHVCLKSAFSGAYPMPYWY